jgi:transcriptional regulator with XRE-family HTH domain
MGRSGTTAVDVALGARIRLLRTTRGMSQTVLGKHLGLTFQQIQKYEKGTNHIAPDRLLRIADILGVSAGVLLEEAGLTRATGEVPREMMVLSRCAAARSLFQSVDILWEADRQEAIAALARAAEMMIPLGPALRADRRRPAATLRLPARAGDRVTS